MASLAPACGGTGEGENGTNSSSSGGSTGCIPGKSEACICTDGQSGAQVCQPNGTFAPCSCGPAMDGGPPPDSGNSLCGNNMMDPGEECDDGNNVDGDGCSSICTINTCPDDIPQPGECGPEGTCPQDCMKCGNGVENPGECGPMGGCPQDCCLPANTQVYAGMVPSSGPVWQYQGLTGLDAGNAACQAMGADHACTYEEIKDAESQQELAAVPVGTTMWFHRTQAAAGAAAPGAGCRCNEWKYVTNHISDGEFGVMQANGVVQDNLDTGSCLFDANNPGMYTAPGLDCGGVSRAIFCCFAQCVKPPTP